MAFFFSRFITNFNGTFRRFSGHLKVRKRVIVDGQRGLIVVSWGVISFALLDLDLFF